MRELAALEADAPALAPQAEVEAEVEAETEAEAETAQDATEDAEEAAYADLPLPQTAPRERPRPASAEADREQELARLMREADTRGATPENRRRMSAIAHLKAAVAATVADRRSRGEDTAKGAEPRDESGPYRADLDQAVRPRRPVSAGPHTARPAVAAPRPAPLVLVSEQRIDKPEPASLAAAAIRPRRISTAEILEVEALEENDEPTPPLDAAEAASFAEFAENLGTQGLADLLEAAAAYTARVEGRPHFSPPQIMRKLSGLDDGADFSREDRLRVFGTLLRQGKIAKVKRGQYAITEASRFYAEARRA